MSLQTLTESEIIMTLIALALLLAFAFGVGTIMELLKAPRVVGEITGAFYWEVLFYTIFSLNSWAEFLWLMSRKVKC